MIAAASVADFGAVILLSLFFSREAAGIGAQLVLLGGFALVSGRRTFSPRETVAAALLQATSLPFIVAASMIGVELGMLDEATSAALIAAGLLSVLLFPLIALMVLRGSGEASPASAA